MLCLAKVALHHFAVQKESEPVGGSPSAFSLTELEEEEQDELEGTLTYDLQNENFDESWPLAHPFIDTHWDSLTPYGSQISYIGQWAVLRFFFMGGFEVSPRGRQKATGPAETEALKEGDKRCRSNIFFKKTDPVTRGCSVLVLSLWKPTNQLEMTFPRACWLFLSWIFSPPMYGVPSIHQTSVHHRWKLREFRKPRALRFVRTDQAELSWSVAGCWFLGTRIRRDWKLNATFGRIVQGGQWFSTSNSNHGTVWLWLKTRPSSQFGLWAERLTYHYHMKVGADSYHKILSLFLLLWDTMIKPMQPNGGRRANTRPVWLGCNMSEVFAYLSPRLLVLRASMQSSRSCPGHCIKWLMHEEFDDSSSATFNRCLTIAHHSCCRLAQDLLDKEEVEGDVFGDVRIFTEKPPCLSCCLSCTCHDQGIFEICIAAHAVVKSP